MKNAAILNEMDGDNGAFVPGALDISRLLPLFFSSRTNTLYDNSPVWTMFHFSLRHVLGENVVFFAKTKIPPRYGIYGLESTADRNPGPKSRAHPISPTRPPPEGSFFHI
jgi:hypothetical protein